MTKKPLIILFVLMILSIIVVSLVSAFSMGNVDGQWSCIEPFNEDCGSAAYDNWATGPPSGSNEYDSVEDFNIYTWYHDQSFYSLESYIDDWNQVRYGGDPESEVVFADQSGFGFDGVNNVDGLSEPYLDTPFLLGKFCHFNNPIEAVDEMEWVNLDIRVDNIQCDPTADSLVPDPDGILNFSYRFTLDETVNNPAGDDCTGGYALCPHNIGSDTYCPYQTGVNALGCADRVDIGALPITDSFTCYYDGAPKNYKIGVLGFIPLSNSLETCSEIPSGDYAYAIISGEEADNCACLYGTVTEVTGTAVELVNFSANFDGVGVELTWETLTEVDNLGFNLYRSPSLVEVKEKLNEDLIPCKVIGSSYGAEYIYMDDDLDGGTYYYWLESLDIFGNAELFGPIEVQR